MRRRVTVLSWMLLLLFSLPTMALGAPRTAAIPKPALAQDGVSTMGSPSVSGTPGSWYVGATPPNVDPAKPVLLFVHGKGGSAQVWWGETVYHGTNDMYAYAYNNGYRTAFVDLQPEGAMWANGQMLSGLLNQITAYFGVSKVTIIAHSKGGVDSNTASVHYGAKSKISRIITLGTPHWGTPLADMAYSTWAWWLAALLGQNTDATYVMQTGYMEYFRSITDNLDPGVAYNTLSGYKCGPFLSALWYGCAAISGEDDGVVPVWSARKPGGVHLREGYWDHDEIRMGSRTWSTFAPYIRTSSATSTATATGAATAGATIAANPVELPTPGNLILRGGEATGEVQTFPLETGVRKATLLFYASSPEFQATLVGPDGSTQIVKMEQQVEAGEIFGGAWIGSVELTSPSAGVWQLTGDAPERTGYLMVASLESDLNAVLDRGRGVAAPGGQRAVAVSLAGAAQVQKSRVGAQITLTSGAPGTNRVPSQAAPFSQEKGMHRAALVVPQESGVYNLTATVTGTLADGSAFERTLVTSFAVLPEGVTGPWQGR